MELYDVRVVLMALASTCWGLSPIIGARSGLSARPLTVLVAIGTVIPTVFWMFNAEYHLFSPKQLGLGLTSGIVNGMGAMCFYALIAGVAAGRWKGPSTIPPVYIGLFIMIVIGFWIFLKDPLTGRKMLGIVTGIAAIYLLTS